MQDIADYIPEGYGNAVTREELRRRTGLNDRSLRAALKASNRLICNLQDGKGYFIPTDGEERLVRAYMRQERRRGLNTTRTAARCAAWIRGQREEHDDLTRNQISLDDYMTRRETWNAEE